jgi:hypothetical protein
LFIILALNLDLSGVFPRLNWIHVSLTKISQTLYCLFSSQYILPREHMTSICLTAVTLILFIWLRLFLHHSYVYFSICIISVSWGDALKLLLLSNFRIYWWSSPSESITLIFA